VFYVNFRGGPRGAPTKPGFTGTPREKDLRVEDVFHIPVKFRDLMYSVFCPNTQGE
jgi:hypothetical protein